MQFWLGTSGYSYPDWVGGFYPPGTRPGGMLTHYVRHFPLVELNFTFYRLPTSAMLARLADQTPPGFQFVVKLPRTLSHEENPKDLAPFRQAVEQMHARDRLMGLLCQLPQSTHDTKRHRAWLERLAEELAGLRLAVEFRHRSWANPDVAPWLRERDVDLVAVDVPNLPNLYPRGLVQSGPTVYVRLHSRNAGNWYKSDKDRYDYSYDDAALREWVGAFHDNPQPTERVLLLFNNCHRSQAAQNAERMRELLGRLLPGEAVVPPPALPEPEAKQRSLFD